MATIGISICIVWTSLALLKRCIRILMQSTPEDVDVRALADAIASCEGVEDVFHLHVWMIDEHMRSTPSPAVPTPAPGPSPSWKSGHDPDLATAPDAAAKGALLAQDERLKQR